MANFTAGLFKQPTANSGAGAIAMSKASSDFSKSLLDIGNTFSKMKDQELLSVRQAKADKRADELFNQKQVLFKQQQAEYKKELAQKAIEDNAEEAFATNYVRDDSMSDVFTDNEKAIKSKFDITTDEDRRLSDYYNQVQQAADKINSGNSSLDYIQAQKAIPMPDDLKPIQAKYDALSENQNTVLGKAINDPDTQVDDYTKAKMVLEANPHSKFAMDQFLKADQSKKLVEAKRKKQRNDLAKSLAAAQAKQSLAASIIKTSGGTTKVSMPVGGKEYNKQIDNMTKNQVKLDSFIGDMSDSTGKSKLATSFRGNKQTLKKVQEYIEQRKKLGLPADTIISEVKSGFDKQGHWVGSDDITIKTPNTSKNNLIGAVNYNLRQNQRVMPTAKSSGISTSTKLKLVNGAMDTALLKAQLKELNKTPQQLARERALASKKRFVELEELPNSTKATVTTPTSKKVIINKKPSKNEGGINNTKEEVIKKPKTFTLNFDEANPKDVAKNKDKILFVIDSLKSKGDKDSLSEAVRLTKILTDNGIKDPNDLTDTLEHPIKIDNTVNSKKNVVPEEFKGLDLTSTYKVYKNRDEIKTRVKELESKGTRKSLLAAIKLQSILDKALKANKKVIGFNPIKEFNSSINATKTLLRSPQQGLNDFLHDTFSSPEDRLNYKLNNLKH